MKLKVRNDVFIKSLEYLEEQTKLNFYYLRINSEATLVSKMKNLKEKLELKDH